MTRRARRFISGLLLAALAFSQGSVALAGCLMDRGEMTQSAAQAEMAGDCPEAAGYANGGMPMPATGCVAHCTLELQAFGTATGVMQAPPPTPIPCEHLFLESRAGESFKPSLPPPGIPPRILLHSFLI